MFENMKTRELSEDEKLERKQQSLMATNIVFCSNLLHFCINDDRSIQLKCWQKISNFKLVTENLYVVLIACEVWLHAEDLMMPLWKRRKSAAGGQEVVKYKTEGTCNASKIKKATSILCLCGIENLIQKLFVWGFQYHTHSGALFPGSSQQRGEERRRGGPAIVDKDQSLYCSYQESFLL